LLQLLIALSVGRMSSLILRRAASRFTSFITGSAPGGTRASSLERLLFSGLPGRIVEGRR
jgi:hypothetical protein